MKNEFLHHKLAYLLLVIGLVALSLAFIGVWPNRMYQRIVAVVIGLFYFGWGLVTHVHTLQLTKRVLYEYAAMAILATLLLLLVTF